MWTAPSATEFKAYFVRDFPYGSDVNNNVLDADITKAIAEAQVHFNPDAFDTNANATIAFMYAAAWALVNNMQTSMKGLSAQARLAVNASSVDGASVNFVVPEDFMRDSKFSMYATNAYGLKYLSYIIPLCVGRMGVAIGETTP